MKAVRLIAVLAIILVASALFFLSVGQNDTALTLTDAAARPTDDGGLAVFVKIENTGGPDRIVGVESSAAGSASLVTPGADLPIPAVSTVQLAPDGAHLLLENVEGRTEAGRLVPITLRFEGAGPVKTRARIAGPDETKGEIGLFGMGDICFVGDGEPAPAIALNITEDGEGWRVEIETDEFEFSEDLVDGPHIPGVGHGHLYVGGVKLQRLYSPSARIGALTPGTHDVRVTLMTNDHRAYVVDDEQVVARAEIVVR